MAKSKTKTVTTDAQLRLLIRKSPAISSFKPTERHRLITSMLSLSEKDQKKVIKYMLAERKDLDKVAEIGTAKRERIVFKYLDIISKQK